MAEVVITGIGLVTPLGCSPCEVLERIVRGERAIQPAPFAPLACPRYAPVSDFDAARYFPENKTLRLMNRDAQMAVVAARLALKDAGLVPGELYSPEEIALFGSTGLSGMPPAEIASLVQHAAGADGSLDLRRFGAVALKRIRPVLSFKILANMPICFVSILENLRGPGAVYTPWQGNGAHALAAGVRAVAEGEVPCAVVGGCDVKSHALSFVSLQQLGVFDSWIEHGSGTVPGEGGAFLVLEERERAARRGARSYACIGGYAVASSTPASSLAHTFAAVLRDLDVPAGAHVLAAGDGEPAIAAAEAAAIEECGLTVHRSFRPKLHIGNLFAADAAVQVALAATMVQQRDGSPVVAHCFGPGSEQAAFLVHAPSPQPSPPSRCRPSPAESPASRRQRDGGEGGTVVVTGIGVVSPVGIGRDAFWSGLTAGRCGIRRIGAFDVSAFPVQIGGEVQAFDATAVQARFPQAARTRDRKVLLALAAAEEAIGDAGLSSEDLQHALLSMGVGLEAICLEDLTPYAHTPDLGRAVAEALAKSGGRDSPWLQTPLDSTAHILGDRYGLRAGRVVNCSACAAGTQAVGEAWQMLRRGRADVALAGAADSMLNPLGLGGFSLLRVLSTENDCPHRACRPFDATRQGTVLGEGAAFLVLETLERALARGATVYAEIVGYGSSFDAYAVSDPDPSGRGAVASMRRAMRVAGLAPEDIDCINAHGTGTPKNDVVETAAIKEALGRRAYEIPVHAIKSMTGHMIAASGAVEAAAAVLTVSRGRVPPTANLARPDPQCDLDYVPGSARPFSGQTVLSNSFGFGGQNATLIFRSSVGYALA